MKAFTVLLITLCLIGCDGIENPPIVLDSLTIVPSIQQVVYPQDPLVINDLTVQGNRLHASLSYSGGCKNHLISLILVNELQHTTPFHLKAYIAHDAQEDLCEAYITQPISFDLQQVLNRSYPRPLALWIYPPNESQPYVPMPTWE